MMIAVRHPPGASVVSGGVGVVTRSVTLSCDTSPPGYPPAQYKWWRTGSPSEILGTESQLTLQQLQLGMVQ